MQRPSNQQTTNESSMSGTTTTNHAATSAKYIAATEYGSQIFSGERGDYGIYKFADPHRQMTYEHHETRFTKMQNLKHAYDKQELLLKMRADIRREYLTRKKQMKRLQMDAAVDFRNAESSLQEHYATEAADHPYIHGVDIHAPLISQIQLPNDGILDLKAFDAEREFAKVRQVHADLLADQQESIRQFEQEQQRQSQYHTIWQRWVEREYKQRSPYEPRGKEQEQPQQEQQQQQEEEQVGRYGDGGYCCCGDLECSDCFSYGGDENDDKDSYNSEYDYPREYNWERECREAEEAEAQAEAPEQQVMDDDTSYQCDDYPDVVTLTEPKERITVAAAGGTISAKTKAKSKTTAAAAAKARIAKKQQNKFAPITVTINTNRVSVEDAESSSTMLYKGKVQINLPKKNMQASSASASREDKKRHDEKWRRINAAQKQNNARGTRIANIPEPRMWWNSGGSDCEE